MKILLCSTALLIGCATTTAPSPLAIERQGHYSTTSCQGQGISLEFARLDAIAACRATVAASLDGTSVEVNERTWETSVGAYQQRQVKTHANVAGLSCLPLKEEVLEETNSHVKVHLRCRFDISKAKLGSVEVERDAERTVAEGDRDLPQYGDLFLVWVTTIPACQKITVRGGEGASEVTCTRNPQPLQIRSKAKSILVETEGYAPLEIKLDKPAPHQRFTAMLDPL